MADNKTRFNLRIRTPKEEHEQKHKSTPSERMKKYRQKLKLDGKYETVKAKDRERHRLTRKLPKTEEQIQKEREQSRIRSKRYRQKLKEQGNFTAKNPIIKTRKERKKMRTYWRMKKRESRLRMNAQKKRRVKEYDRKRKFDEITEISEGIKSGKKRKIDKENTYSTPEAMRKATSRARKVLPSHPKKFAIVLSNIIHNASPQKKEELEQHGVTSPTKTATEHIIVENVKSKLVELKSDKNARRKLVIACIAGKHRKATRIREHLGLKYTHLRKLCSIKERAKRSDALNTDNENTVKDFFLHPDISTIYPNRRTVNHKGKNRYYMQKTLDQAQKEFRKTHGIKIGKSKFASLRPKNVKVKSAQPLNQCLCEYCLNVELKLKSLGNRSSFKSKYDIVNFTMCGNMNKKYNSHKCVFRTCKLCGVKNLEKKLESDLEDCENLKWLEWGDIKKGNKTVKGLRNVTDSKKIFIQTLCRQVDFLARHLFNASWEHSQFSEISKNMPKNWVVSVMDFGRNYICEHQDEPQFMHYSLQQITVHPVVTYYRCKSCEEVVKEDIVMLSDDIGHDASAVLKFQSLAYAHLQNTRNLEIDHIVEFTDGCAAQYKSKVPFYNVSRSQSLFGCSLQRCFFGSRHGKGPGDQTIGYVKSRMSTAVKSREVVISCAKDAFNFCNENLAKEIDDNNQCQHKLMKFICENEIKHTTKENIKTVKGTRSLHCVASVSPNIIHTRNLSCFCEHCKVQNYDQCVNKEYVEKFKKVSLDGKVLDVDDCLDEEVQEIDSVSENTKQQEEVTEVTTNTNVQEMQTTPEPLLVCKGVEKKIKDGENGQIKNVMDVKPEEIDFDGSILDLQNKNVIDEISVEVNQLPIDRQNFFKDLQKTLQQSLSYEDFEVKCTEAFEHLSKYKVTLLQPSIVSSRSTVDQAALDLMPNDTPGSVKYPVTIYGDGNCLPRCGTVYSGLDHVEIRMRIVLEGILYQDLYLDNEYLSKGHDEKKNIAAYYAQYCEEFDPAAKLTPVVIRRIYHAEMMKMVKSGTYMGMWELFCLASVLQCKIHSVYPKYGGVNVRKDLNRIVYPRNECQGEAFIMWSHTRGCEQEPLHWNPNHFVALLPIDDLPHQDISYEPITEIEGESLLYSDVFLGQCDIDDSEIATEKTSPTYISEVEFTTDLNLDDWVTEANINQSWSDQDDNMADKDERRHHQEVKRIVHEDVKRHSVGSYLLVRNGSLSLPAVVTKLEHPFLWINYFSKTSSGGWLLEETDYTILERDVECTLDPPDLLISGGSRFKYRFNL